MEPKNKLISYRLTYDTMFAPNPFGEILTLATCKPMIRRSKNTRPGMWIAGWTACTLHNAKVWNRNIDPCRQGEEKLIYLAQIDEIIYLDVYWKKYPQKRCKYDSNMNQASYYGDNIYHKDEKNNMIIQELNHGDHDENDIQRDYKRGERAIICKRFFYFTPDKRLKIPEKYRNLVHKAKGHSIKSDENIEEFIQFVISEAEKEGVKNGIVGRMPVNDNLSTLESNNESRDLESPVNQVVIKKRGCSR